MRYETELILSIVKLQREFLLGKHFGEFRL
ncbi:hypothetical protein OIU79_023077 [Salix purpurea]|uniref:Uncharacterized protein n=1 Tax=Salix purpurea TaxID=77065 RepID=A0A9Q0WHN0_SALPP|nr:hypothetical protein OIU79_023077 [Salix purpurea]